MTIHKALLIPADLVAPLQDVDFDDNDVDSWGPQVGVHDGNVGVMSYRPHGVQVIHDDIAFLRDEEVEVNLRMNMLDGKFTSGGGIRLTNMLRGDFLLVGLTEWGDSADIPQHVVDLARETQKEAVVLGRKVAEAEVRLKEEGLI